jgi:hypothetical protein
VKLLRVATLLVLTAAFSSPAHAEPTSDLVYGEGVVVERDVNGQRLQYTTHQLQTDDLVLPSGAIVVWDAFLVFGAQPLEHTVNPGAYPVILTLTHDQGGDVRVAFARVEIEGPAAVRWEHASTYNVSSGIAALMDAEALNQAIADYNPYGDAVLGALTYAVEHDEYWTSVVVVPDSGADAVILAAGYGEGDYTAYWGFDENDTPVALLLDFNILAP